MSGYARYCDTRTVRCACGRWADSDGRGQCWICAGRATYAGEPASHRFTARLLAVAEAIWVSLAKAGWLED